MFVWKDENKQKKRPGLAHLKNLERLIKIFLTQTI